MSSLNYTNAKLYDVIYILTTHEGDARKRLAYVIDKLKVIQATFSEEIPDEITNEFNLAMEMIEKGRSKYIENTGLKDYTLPHIINSTASKIIKKLVSIQYKIESLIENTN